MTKVSKAEAILHNRVGVNGRYYQLPNVNGGLTVSYATFTGEHGERTIGDQARIYYILRGKAKFEVNNEIIEASENDVVAIPSFGTYNMWPISDSVKVILFMEFLDFEKLKK